MYACIGAAGAVQIDRLAVKLFQYRFQLFLNCILVVALALPAIVAGA